MNDTPNADASNAQPADTNGADVSLEDNISNAFDAVEEKYAEEDAAAAAAEEAPAQEVKTDEAAAEELTPEQKAAAEAEAAASAEQQPAGAPERFTDAAKAEWATTPPAVQAEVERMRSELESGIEEYREKLAPYEGLEDFAKMATDGGTTLKDAMAHYSGLEDIFRKDPIAGFNRIAQNMGLNFHQVAAQVLNVNPNQQAVQYQNHIQTLQTEIAGLQSQLQNVDTKIDTRLQAQQTEAQIQSDIEAFKADNPHFETVRGDMSLLIESGRAKDLPEAYGLAVKMHGLTVEEKPSKEATKKETQAAQTQKANLSVSGAPEAGSKAATKATKSKTTREAVEAAFAATDG